ncbi:MAG: hypothetical protein BMS9Abin37_1876 [Acidobacteriota bacterium]|nr:MAG: hypothetical protein BMS9Abin37_1876 [Acidobacteriota bacterium]
MAYTKLNRFDLAIQPLCERANRVLIERDRIPADQQPRPLDRETESAVEESVQKIRRARTMSRPVILTFGAHAIKNGLAPVFIRLMERGWVTHLATNGAGIIHDWEFSFQGKSSENVRANVYEGTFGIWQETGFTINLALIVGAYEGLGYGESVGSMIENECLNIPESETLLEVIRDGVEDAPEKSSAAADLLWALRTFGLEPGTLKIPHSGKAHSVQAAAYRLEIPFTGHPMFGQDIIYNHPMSCGAAIGRTAERDFLSFAHSVAQLEHGVYLSLGSAVMSPMIFEKSLSMAQNLERQRGGRIQNHHMVVVDLAESQWNWQRDGEPPPDNPAYYLRYCKTFSRMGGHMQYLCMDNREFLLHLLHGLERT